MTRPKRIHLRRTKGWRKPDSAIVVARPSRWGNPYRVEDYRDAYPGWADAELRVLAVSDFRGLVEGRWDRFDDVPAYPRDELDELRGRDLACWCPLDQPCHADVLLELANGANA